MAFRKLIAASAAIATIISAAPGAAQDGASRTFTMQGSWTLDAGDDYCRLAGTFADGSDEIALALERNRAENFARLILVGDALVTYRGTQALGYSYLPEGGDRSAMFLRSETGDGTPYFNLGTVIFGANPFAAPAAGPAAAAPVPAAPPEGGFVLPPYDREAELAYGAGIEGIAITEGLREPIRIATGNMRAPLEALQACADDLLRVWGLDFNAHRAMTRRAAPVGNAYEWLATNTIGFGDFALLAGGANPIRVMVDAAGEPTSCHAHWPTLDARKNERICEQIMENGEFTPALDAEGQPMASYWMVDPAFGLTRPFGGR